MTELTQATIDKMIENLKKEVLEVCAGEPLGKVIVSEDNNLSSELAIYELEIRPQIEELGLKSPTLTELFGIEISITEKS